MKATARTWPGSVVALWFSPPGFGRFSSIFIRRPRRNPVRPKSRSKPNLGNALSVLGERESGTARLEEAVAAYRDDALKERTHERVPLQWAMTQVNLGTALEVLGERESGTAKLEEAVAAYRDALKERTRERVPLDWAVTQIHLGNALQTLGERESGTARLEEAVSAYRDALKEKTRERVPLQWAVTQIVSAMCSGCSAGGRAGRQDSERPSPPIATP
jgi:exonuclease VII small subunit